MVLGSALLFFAELLPLAPVLQGWRLGLLIALSSGMALMIGSCVPAFRHSILQADAVGMGSGHASRPAVAWDHP
jgi:hypothetical protein